ncbi:MAG: hypothetical protein IT308_02660 [Anaerolineaceae bacterium]|nr:hypothetical protein [Anaerolineaceae bacterium]
MKKPPTQPIPDMHESAFFRLQVFPPPNRVHARPHAGSAYRRVVASQQNMR